MYREQGGVVTDCGHEPDAGWAVSQPDEIAGGGSAATAGRGGADGVWFAEVECWG